MVVALGTVVIVVRAATNRSTGTGVAESEGRPWRTGFAETQCSGTVTGGSELAAKAAVAATLAAANTLSLGLSATLGEAGATIAFTAAATGTFAITALSALVVGAAPSISKTSVVYTYDCWKPVVHDDTPDPSNGRLLGELAANPRIKNVHTSANNESSLLPEIILENIWNERFLIQYVKLLSGEMVAHAMPLE